MLRSARAGDSDYTRYDGEITKSATAWLRSKGKEVGSRGDEKPWVLMVSLVAPHFPLTVPAEYFDLYSGMPLKMPKAYRFGVDESAHPFIQQYARLSGYKNHFKDESDVRRALAGYYGLISYLDANIGRVLEALQEAGLVDDTRIIYIIYIIYISDHGDNAGARGLWGKSTMYSESVGIPLIISGPNATPSKTETAAVSHVDVYNSILDAVGHDLSKSTACARAQSVFGPLRPNRLVLSEYHTIGSKSAGQAFGEPPEKGGRTISFRRLTRTCLLISDSRRE
ncbi:sulfatase-like hydrolase/transferase [Variovorax sp. GB1P17]|uniref:sulfatase-like hydrolase/transferase n=1 Tax=Variovorax sp. GB1P17 TaxID=3443740 RepID=UPI003F44C9CC